METIMYAYEISKQKLVNPSASRNSAPILEVIKNYLTSGTPGHLLEISSGTGQHASYFAPNFPNITFQPSEYDGSMLPHIQTYIESCSSKNIKSPLHIDICKPIDTWNLNVREFDFMININMIHISPFICTESLFKNAGILLKPGGLLITYGPYANNGVIEPQSNINFDKMLKSQNSDWGIRDIVVLKDLAKLNGIDLFKMHDMPANNKCIIWKKM